MNYLAEYDSELPIEQVQYQYLRQTIDFDQNRPLLTWGRVFKNWEGERYAGTADGYTMNLVKNPELPTTPIGDTQAIQFQESVSIDNLTLPDFAQASEGFVDVGGYLKIETTYDAIERLSKLQNDSGAWFHFDKRDAYIMCGGAREGGFSQMGHIGKASIMDGSKLTDEDIYKPRRWSFSLNRFMQSLHPNIQKWEIHLPHKEHAPYRIFSVGKPMYQFSSFLMPMTISWATSDEEREKIKETQTLFSFIPAE